MRRQQNWSVLTQQIFSEVQFYKSFFSIVKNVYQWNYLNELRVVGKRRRGITYNAADRLSISILCFASHSLSHDARHSTSPESPLFTHAFAVFFRHLCVVTHRVSMNTTWYEAANMGACNCVGDIVPFVVRMTWYFREHQVIVHYICACQCEHLIASDERWPTNTCAFNGLLSLFFNW